MPTADAIQCVLVTTPNVPDISGLVVNVMLDRIALAVILHG
ncbi:MAG: hypothetical protein ACR2O2_00185 [Ruegeria sp.]